MFNVFESHMNSLLVVLLLSPSYKCGILRKIVFLSNVEETIKIEIKKEMKKWKKPRFMLLALGTRRRSDSNRWKMLRNNKIYNKQHT